MMMDVECCSLPSSFLIFVWFLFLFGLKVTQIIYYTLYGNNVESEKAVPFSQIQK